MRRIGQWSKIDWEKARSLLCAVKHTENKTLSHLSLSLQPSTNANELKMCDEMNTNRTEGVVINGQKYVEREQITKYRHHSIIIIISWIQTGSHRNSALKLRIPHGMAKRFFSFWTVDIIIEHTCIEYVRAVTNLSQSDKEIWGMKCANELGFDWDEANYFDWMNLLFCSEHKICAVVCLNQMGSFCWKIW